MTGRSDHATMMVSVELPAGFPVVSIDAWRRLSLPEKRELEALRAAEAVRHVRDFGYAPVEVADALGVHKNRVHAWLDAAGVEREPRRGRALVAARDGGSALRAARKAAGLTQIGLDKAAGIAESTVCRLEGRAGFAISSEKAVRIAAVLKQDGEVLFAPLPPRQDYDRHSRTCPPTPRGEMTRSMVEQWQQGSAEADKRMRTEGLYDIAAASAALDRAPHSVSRLAGRLGLGERLAPVGQPGSRLLLSDADLDALRERVGANNVAGLHGDAHRRGVWYLHRHGTTAMFGRQAKAIAAQRNRRAGPHSPFDRADVKERLQNLVGKRFPEQRIANILSDEFKLEISRDQVYRAKKKLRASFLKR